MKNLSNEAQRQINVLEEAIEKLNEAYELISSVVGGDQYTSVYLLKSLSHLANDDCNLDDLSVPQIIEDIKSGESNFKANW